MTEQKRNLIPNSTQIPNVILDIILPRLPESEGKCLLYICRRTFGFHKDYDQISFSQFVDGITDRRGNILDYGTGLARSSVAEALKNLISSGMILVVQCRRGNYYQINLEIDVDKVVQKMDWSRKWTKRSSKSGSLAVRESNEQNLGNKEKQSIGKNSGSAVDNFTARVKELARSMTINRFKN